MLILCPNGHGAQTPAQVSPDYDETQRAMFRFRCLIVRFIYDGQPVDQYFLSPEFISAEHVEVGDQPLPANYPAQKLVNYRKALGITQGQFATQIGVDPSTLARWERGERPPDEEQFQKLRTAGFTFSTSAATARFLPLRGITPRPPAPASAQTIAEFWKE